MSSSEVPGGPAGAQGRGRGDAGAPAPASGSAPAGPTGRGRDTSADLGADVGLLNPVVVGTAAEAATGDAAFLQAMLDAEAALTRALAATGAAPQAAADAVTAVARTSPVDVRELALAARAGGNPVIPLVKALRAAVPADVASYVHRGATSQDVMDTAAMLVAAHTLPGIADELDAAASRFARLAREHRDTPMAGRTLGQHAVPTTFGLKAAGWYTLVRDAAARVRAVRLPAQLGGAAGTLAAFEAYGADPLAVADAYARELGLVAPALPWHTLRTPIADLAAALGFTAGALGKVAADVLVLSRTEIGEVAEGSGGGSSAMPHKSNPVRSTLVASAARQAPALVSVLMGSLVAEDERPTGAWHAEWQTLRELLRLAGGAAHATAELAEGLVVFPERMRAGLDLTHGLVTSERVAAFLGRTLGRERAEAITARAATEAATQGIPLGEALAAVLGDFGGLPEGLTDPTAYVGAAGRLVDRALADVPVEGGDLEAAGMSGAPDDPGGPGNPPVPSRPVGPSTSSTPADPSSSGTTHFFDVADPAAGGTA